MSQKPWVKTYAGNKPNYTTPADEIAKGKREHEPWCDSVTKLLLSMPPQIPPCNCKPKREWVGLTDEEVFQAYKPEMEGMPFNKPTLAVIAGYIEAKLKEKNT